jgi:hypothetical protein
MITQMEIENLKIILQLAVTVAFVRNKGLTILCIGGMQQAIT